MTQTHRQKLILDYIQTYTEITVEEACKMFQSSPATIRRDFNQISEGGKAIKTWGGLMRNPQNDRTFGAILSLASRKQSYLEEKIRIAKRAAQLIEEGNVVFIDGGTTTLQMAEYIANKQIRVITNSMIIASEIDRVKTSKQGAEVFVTGGFLYPDSGLLVGTQTNAFLTQYHADIAFISAGALDSQGIYNSNQWVVESELAMIQQSTKTVLLVDSSKFGKKHMCKMCDFEVIHQIITDMESKNSVSSIPYTHIDWIFV